MNQAQRATVRLRDAQKACAQLQEVIAGQTAERYKANITLQWAVQRGLEIIGESVNQAIRLDPLLLAALPDSLVIVGMRNRIAHGYEDLNLQLIWDSVVDDIPVLLTAIEEALATRPALDPIPEDFDSEDYW